MQAPLSPLAAALGAALAVMAAPAWAETAASALPDVTVSATRIDMADQDAPYASEVHTRADIERASASTLYDYLAQQTSLQITPAYGNRYAPSINMRGYGSTDGYQNVVVTVNGRRLNNVDMVPQLLGAISLADIERIEITKGSGAVRFGDGATAGTIQIYTKARNGASLEAYAGSHGQRGAIATAGLAREQFDLSATLDHGRTGGFSDRDLSGNKDHSEANTWGLTAGVRPIDGLRVELEAGAAHIDTRYPDPLSVPQFDANPGMNKGTNYTHQQYETKHWGLGVDYALNDQWKFSARHRDERKDSVNATFNMAADYRSTSNEVALQFSHQGFILNAGWQNFDGQRSDAANTTRKKNDGVFLHGQYRMEQLTVSAGLRREHVRYRYAPTAGQALEGKEHLTSWELGGNYRFSPALSAFASLSSAFQAPDIDRFFLWGGAFNGFIVPAKSKTLTLGLNHQTERNRLKASVFYARLKNEIYLEPVTWANTNIDKSHKYGLEVQDRFALTPGIAASVNYTWTRARIDRENEGAGAYNGNDLPGVPRHAVVLGLDVRVADQGLLHLSHNWRSTAWAEGDFANANPLRQRIFQSTDVNYRHRFAKNVEGYVGVSNLFDRKNGIWISGFSTSVYPVNFERTWKLGAKIQF